MFAASKTAAASGAAPTDPDFNYVTMLLHGDGTNGAQNNTFLDSSTNNFTITRNGTPTQGSFSPYGDLWSNFFSGSGQYLTTASSGTATGDFTYEAWVYPTASATGIAITVGSEATGRALMYVNASQQLAWGVFAVGDFPLGGTVTLNQWSHIALVRSGTTVRGYVNGTVLGTTTTYSGTAGNANGFAVGAGKTGGTPFAGFISNARVVNGTAVYTSNFTPSTTPLTAITNTSLLTCQSNRFIDNSSNNFTLTRTGTPSVQRFSPFDPAAAYSTSVIGGSGIFNRTVGDYLSIANNAALNMGTSDFTLEAWIYPTGTGVIYSTIFDKDGKNTVSWPQYNLYLNTSFNVLASFSAVPNTGASPTALITSSSTIPINTWTHVAVTRIGVNATLWVNGVSAGTSSSVPSNLTNGARPLLLGYQDRGATYDNTFAFNGNISNARIVKGTAVYTATFTPPTAPITAITNTQLLTNFTNAGIFDNAMMNNLVTVGNAQVSTAVTKFGTGSMAFDGTGDYLSFPVTENIQFGSGDFTVEFWMYSSGINTQALMAFPHNASNYANVLFYGASATSLVFYSSSNGTSWNVVNGAAVGTISLNAWNHVAVSKQGSSIRCFLNGVLGSTTTFAGTFAGTYDRAWIGDSAGNTAYNGYIDDLRITKGIARYTANFTPPTAAFPNN